MRTYLLIAASLLSLTAPSHASNLSAPQFNWTGFYVGANVGLGIANTNYSTAMPGIPDLGLVIPDNGQGLVLGGQVGFNYQINRLVVGVEADYGYFGVSRYGRAGFGMTQTWSTKWDASIRGRLGVTFDRALMYVTGGVAWADFGVRGQAGPVSISLPFIDYQQTNVRTGFQLGGGIEYALTENVTVRGEYLYGSFGTRRMPFTSEEVGLREHKVRIGVSYLFR